MTISFLSLNHLMGEKPVFLVKKNKIRLTFKQTTIAKLIFTWKMKLLVLFLLDLFKLVFILVSIKVQWIFVT